MENTLEIRQWYLVKCYFYTGLAQYQVSWKGNYGWYFEGSDLLVDLDEVEVLSYTPQENKGVN